MQPMRQRRQFRRLAAISVETITQAGRFSDGENLYLVVHPGGARNWEFQYVLKGRQRVMGLGSTRRVNIHQARQMAAEARALKDKGIDPIDARDAAKAAAAVVVVAKKTFGEIADQLIESKRPSWRSAKHALQWESTLGAPCAAIRNMPVEDVDTTAVLKVLSPLWSTIPETASRLRSRIELVLSRATAQGLRTGDNPATWRGHLEAILPKRTKFERGHHAALPYADVPAFLVELRRQDTVSAWAFEFAILTATRVSETLGAMWSEIDADLSIWCITADRMKLGITHKVPLSDQALSIIRCAETIRSSGPLVFPGRDGQRQLPVNSLNACLRGRDATAHGMRSAFRTWASEKTDFSREVCEMALAHTVGTAVELSYRRTDFFDRRRELMEAWGAFCAGGAA